MTDPRPCKVALVGAGYMATEHARAFAAVPGVQLVGVQSRTRARAEALAQTHAIPVVADSIDELYERTKADLVVVTVVELSMNAVSRECFRLPWTILLEKPAGYTLADAESIAAAAGPASARTFVALNRRFYASTRAAVTDLADDSGRRLIKVQDQEAPTAALAAGQPPVVVENWMYANSVHVVDYFRIFGRGRITRVEPVVAWEPGAPWLVVTRVDFDSGDVGLYEALWDVPGPWAVNVTTRERRWELRPLEKAAIQRQGERRLQPLDDDPVDTAFKPGLRKQAEEAVRAALGVPHESVTLHDALQTMRLIDRVYAPDARDVDIPTAAATPAAALPR